MSGAIHIVHRISPDVSYRARAVVACLQFAAEVRGGAGGAGRPGQAPVVGQGHQLGRVGGPCRDDGRSAAHAER